jgi:hypothetical protein
MKPLTDEIKDVISKSELVTLVTAGSDGPHVIATWGSYIASLDVNDGETLLIPAGGFKQTELNLKQDDRVILMIGSRQSPGKRGMGTGYRLSGRAHLETEGSWYELVKSKFSWARAALVVKVEKTEQLI